MLSRRHVFPAALAALLGVAAPTFAATRPGPATRFDKDGTLDVKELKGRLTQQEFTAADPDNDGTLSKDEYLAVVERRFKAADPDNDGTVSAAELKTAAGRSLTQLMS
jgi:hypothetical protein